MPRFLVPYLLIAVVLVCPYQCWANSLSVQAGQHPAPTCKCCHDKSPVKENTPPASDDRQHDCLCQGATCDAPRTADYDFAPQAGPLLAQVVQNCGESVLSRGDCFARIAAEPAAPASGWEICLRACALLL